LWYNLNDEDKYENTKIWQFRERERVNATRRVLDFIIFLIKTKHFFNSAFCFKRDSPGFRFYNFFN